MFDSIFLSVMLMLVLAGRYHQLSITYTVPFIRILDF